MKNLMDEEPRPHISNWIKLGTLATLIGGVATVLAVVA